MVFIFPYKFFIAKEFLFIFWDEVINKSLSSKIDELKQRSSMKNVITKNMVQKIRSDIYVIVRQPYLRLSNRKYYTLTSLLVIPTIIFSIVFFFCDSLSELKFPIILTLILRLFMTPILSIVMMVFPGALYYIACIREEEGVV